MAYEFVDYTGHIGVTLTGHTREELFAAAASAFTDCLTALDGVEPRQPEEVDVAAPEIDLLLVDFLSELLYRFDTRGWLTRRAHLDIREQDGGWSLEGTLLGERLALDRHAMKARIKGVTYQGLHMTEDKGLWRADVAFIV